MQHLSNNTTLQGGKYKIEQVLGQGGFGITYLAENTMLNGKVAIKEFFFKEYCERDESTSHVTICTTSNRELVERFKQKFIKEARNIFKLNHPNIVRILDIFEENNTAYYVMDFAENGSLAAKVKDMGYLPEPLATRYIVQVAEALDYIHQRNMNHLDVKPGNIMLNEDDNAVLIDFGLSKQYDAQTGSQTSTTPVGISHGYAPLEQYKEGGLTEFSPETDIYALGATFFKLLTGVTPPNASDINEDGVPVETLKAKGVSDKAIAVICKAMESRKKLRMDSAREFINSLQGSMPTPLHDEDEATAMLPTAKAYEQKQDMDEATVYSNAYSRNLEEKKTKVRFSKNILWAIVGGVIVAALFLGGSGLKYIGKAANNDSTTTGSPQKGPSYKSITIQGKTFEMAFVEAETFVMGATSEMVGARDDERPTHQVTLTKNYYIGKTEVTQELWGALMNDNPSEFKDPNNPVENVSWYDCQEFIKELNKYTNLNFRLPTEAEWEFAARGGVLSHDYMYSGGHDPERFAWFANNCGEHYISLNEQWGYETLIGNNCHPHKVAELECNELGIYDMSGNVYEWCQDSYDGYTRKAQTDPTGPSESYLKVIRGGSWCDDLTFCRSSARRNLNDDMANSDTGFRLVLEE